MSVQTVTSFVGLSVFGVLFGILIPDNSCKNALKILLSLIITAALLKVAAGINLPESIDSVVEDTGYVLSEKDLYKSAGSVIRNLTEVEISTLVEEFTGSSPYLVACTVDFVVGEFILTAVKISCECDNPQGVAKYVAAKMGVAPSIIEVTGR